jgi:hypothetical protein
LGFQLGVFVLGEGVDSLRSCLETYLGVAVFVGETLAHGLVAIVGLVEQVNLCLQKVKLSTELAHKVANIHRLLLNLGCELLRSLVQVGKNVRDGLVFIIKVLDFVATFQVVAIFVGNSGEGYSAAFSMLRDGMCEVVLNVGCSSSRLPLSSAAPSVERRRCSRWMVEPWSGCRKGVYTYALLGLLSPRLLAVVTVVLVVVEY